jgi:hypothetical protein
LEKKAQAKEEKWAKNEEELSEQQAGEGRETLVTQVD